jgi:hypothetical protein
MITTKLSAWDNLMFEAKTKVREKSKQSIILYN